MTAKTAKSECVTDPQPRKNAMNHPLERPPLRCDECGMLCDDWTAFDGGVVVICAPCLIDGPFPDAYEQGILNRVAERLSNGEAT
jgi:hypothetical protein